MAVVNTKSTIVTTLDSPGKAVALNTAGARSREQVATVEVAAADDDTSVYRLFRVRSSWRLSAISIYNDAITGGTSYDCGIYQTAANGAAVVDADVFATAVSMATARTDVPVNVLFEALNIDQIEKTVWQMLGLTSDPGLEYDIALTANTVGTAAGTISAVLRYVEGS